MAGRSFIKMHGLGNDFVVVDARSSRFAPSEATARLIADRRFGIGCDQIVILEPAANGRADLFMRFWNSDGGEVDACGNGTRCAAALVMAEAGRESLVIETRAGLLAAHAAERGRVTVDMGAARIGWREIPLAREQDTLHLELSLEALRDPVAVNMGNPHAVFFVEDAEAVDLPTLGPRLERDPLFPERANIGIAQVTGKDALRLRVCERGAGITRACGTGACAAAVAAARRGLTGRRVTVALDGGSLDIDWREDGHVMMTGPVTTVFTGELDLEALKHEMACRGAQT